MTSEIYELIFRGLKAKYPGQAIGPRFHAVCAALDGGEGSGKFGHEGRPGHVVGSGEGGGKTKNKEYQPLKKLLGKEFTGVKGQKAVEKLLQEKQGHVKGAFTRQDIGDIDLVWGNEKQGLCHILARRNQEGIDTGEFVMSLADVIENGSCVLNPNTKRFEISKSGKKAIIDFREDETASSRFVLTAFLITKK